MLKHLNNRRLFKHYINKWVAMDEKDRIVSFADNRKKMLGDVSDFYKYLEHFRVRIYRIYDKDESNIIRGFLD